MPDGGTAPYEEMTTSLLASQPLTVTDKSRPSDKDWGAIYTHLQSRLGSMRSWRYSWWAYWAVLAEYFLPRRYKWLVTANTMTRGRPINDAIIDGTGTMAVRVASAGLYSGLTNPARPWFKLKSGLPWVELDSEGKEWMEDTENRLYAVLHASNFYEKMAQAFEDVVVFGTAPVIIYEDAEDIIRLYSPCAGEYYLDVGGRLSVDTLYREFTLNVIQIVDMFQVENCPPQVVELWEQGGASLENEYIVCHAIEPNFPISARGRNSKPVRPVSEEFPYREVYWLKGIKGNRALSMRGFESCPFVVARWSTVSNDAYGRSLCMDALGDNKQVQLETLRKAEFIEKGVRPPMGADPELKNEPASIIPGMITYVNTTGGKKGFYPLFEPNPGWLGGVVNDIATVSQRIERCLLVDVFMAITRMEGVQPRNELEISKRDLERLQILGPFVDRFENEFAGPALRRILDIMERRRLLKPKPESLRNHPLKIEYDSITRIAQASATSVAMKDVFATAGALSAAAKAAQVPDPIRTLNLDKALRQYGELNNFPASCVFTDEEVAQNDQAAQQGKAQAEVLPTTMAGVSAAKTLADTPVGGDSMLNAILTGQTGG